MRFLKGFICVLTLAAIVEGSWAIKLQMKFEKNQTRQNNNTIQIKANVDVQGDARIVASAQGSLAADLKYNVQDVDDKGIGTLEYTFEGFNIDMTADVDMGDGKKNFAIDLSKEGGTATIDGATQSIDPIDMKEAQSWTVKMDPQGAVAGMSIDLENINAAESANLQETADKVTELLKMNPPLPKDEVEVGKSWEFILNIGDITKELAKENPMLQALTELGIPEVKSTQTLKEIRQVAGKEVAIIDTNTNFTWTDGKINLGVVNLTVRNLSLKSEGINELDNTEGYLPHSSSTCTFEFDLGIESVLGGGSEPQKFDAKGQIQMDLTSKMN